MTNNIVSGTSTFGALIGDLASEYALITQGARSIGDLYPHVVVEETHSDELAITQHPVEFGTPVTDHAFKQPETVELRCGWSNSTAASSGYVQAVYRAFLSLQAKREPFNISTGKRQYNSMLLRSLLVKTDPESEFTLMCVATAQRIVITGTQMTGGSSAENTNGANAIGNIGGSTLTGEAGAQIGNGVGTIPASSVSPDAFGSLSWPNDVSPSGVQNLTASGAGGPTVESLTANQGV
jgi:hypothetical protein